MKASSQVKFAIFVAAIGYFVDVFDIILFTTIRVPSLRSIGIPDDQITNTGIFLLNCQLIGMIVGGILWGILGDKKGRLSVLFGSILLYSIANLANAYVTSIPMYMILRFLAGVGLAGELGAGVTLVSELMSNHTRGIGTMLVAVCGCSGGIFGGYMATHLEWRSMYLLGGSMGLVLLILRWKVNESGLFKNLLSTNIQRGNIFFFAKSWDLLRRYLQCLFLGIPFWIFIGLLGTLAPELAKNFSGLEGISGAKAIMYLNIGVCTGELTSSLISQLLRSRKKAVAMYVSFAFLCALIFFTRKEITETGFYTLYLLMGLGGGYWALFIMFSVEQFGTNLRATASTSLPNFVRGMVVPLSLILTWMKPSLGITNALAILCTVCFLIAFYSLFHMKETFATDLNFTEKA